ncbi:uncharacterized protein LOC113794830 [Dermatophagoides pteronyssinus]|uniref:uncharacterized protein LOC113794830 n=1 Tax=Dermatophagoides pteronyssinus TaxID=6956 RepID=UPI003F66382B
MPASTLSTSSATLPQHSSTMSTTVVSRPKQVIKEYCRQKHLKGPVYYLTHEEKVDLQKHYTVQLLIDDMLLAKGIGLSRRNAEFKAALEAIRLFHENDPSILELINQTNNDRSFGSLRRRRPSRNDHLSMNRSFSVDYISKANRVDSFTSMANGHYDPNDGRQSITPSIDGIDSITLKSHSLSSSNNVSDDKSKDNLHHQQQEISSDEGVWTAEESECSNSSRPSPKLNNHPKQTSKLLNNNNNNDNNTKRSFSFFPSSFLLLNSLRDFSRRSFRRSKSNNNNSDGRKFEIDSEPSSSASSSTTTSSSSSVTSRPTSSSSSSSSSTTFSSNSSSSLNNNHHHPEDQQTISLINDDAAIHHHHNHHHSTINHYQSSNIMAESIIEEDEEQEQQEQQQQSIDGNDQKELSSSSSKKHNEMSNGNINGNGSIIRSYSSSLLLSSYHQQQQQGNCQHNHFSLYGPILCNSTDNCSIIDSHRGTTIESSPSAILLKYCIRMYLPLPYYDIHFDNRKFWVTCRVIMSNDQCQVGTNSNTNYNNGRKRRHPIPDKYIDHQFTAKGYGEILRTARNSAAKLIIDKLTAVGLFHQE